MTNAYAEPACRTLHRGPVQGEGDFIYFLDNSDRIRRSLCSGELTPDDRGELVNYRDVPKSVLQAFGFGQF